MFRFPSSSLGGQRSLAESNHRDEISTRGEKNCEKGSLIRLRAAKVGYGHSFLRHAAMPPKGKKRSKEQLAKVPQVATAASKPLASRPSRRPACIPLNPRRPSSVLRLRALPRRPHPRSAVPAHTTMRGPTDRAPWHGGHDPGRAVGDAEHDASLPAPPHQTGGNCGGPTAHPSRAPAASLSPRWPSACAAARWLSGAGSCSRTSQQSRARARSA